MKKLEKRLSAIACALLLSTAFCPAYAVSAAEPNTAATETIQPRLSFIRTSTASFSSDGSFYTSASVTSDVSYVDMTVELQKKSGSSYSTVDTLTATKKGPKAIYSDSFDLGSGTYRIKVTFEAVTSSGSSETVVKYAS